MIRQTFRKHLYRLEVRFGLTSAEFRGLLLFAALLVLGISVRELGLRIPAVDPAIYQQLDKEFAQRSERFFAQAMVGPTQVELPVQTAASIATLPARQLLDINTATTHQLETLPRIGPALAGRIVRYRETFGPFLSVHDLLLVQGIGPTVLKGLQLLVTASPLSSSPAAARPLVPLPGGRVYAPPQSIPPR
jgi:competence ComEA-like helix-hairpin-helix protein